MKIFFIRVNNESHGPYSLEELKSLHLKEQDFVWKEGLTDWIKAKELPELNLLFKSKTPPPFNPIPQIPENDPLERLPKISTTEKIGFKLGKNLKWIAVFGIIVTIGIYSFNRSSSNYSSPYSLTEKTPEQLRLELIEQEKQNPSQYLNDQTTIRENLLGQKVIEGTITNTASVASFKDMVLEINFLSKTQAVISTMDFTIYELIAPHQTVKFKFKTYAPSGTMAFGASIINATATN